MTMANAVFLQYAGSPHGSAKRFTPSLRLPTNKVMNGHQFSRLSAHLNLEQQQRQWGITEGLRGGRGKKSCISAPNSNSRAVPIHIRAAAAAAEDSPSEWLRQRASQAKRVWKKRVASRLRQVEVTPVALAKWAAMAALLMSAVKTLMNPNLWMYGTWYLAAWPWPTALLLGVFSVVAFWRKSRGKAREWEQLVMVTGALTWLIAVPHAHLNGYIDGWPLSLFFLYYAFFLINYYLRKTVYGSITVPSDNEWTRKNSPSKIIQIVFVACVVGAHWAAAYESPLLLSGDMSGGLLKNLLCSLMIFLAMILHYYGSYFFLKYAVGQIQPIRVVMFGPYRWIRHPVYASYMLFFVGCFMALHAHVSLAIILVASVIYYEHKSRLEEKRLVEAFGEGYTLYKNKVKRKYIPLIY